MAQHHQHLGRVRPPLTRAGRAATQEGQGAGDATSPLSLPSPQTVHPINHLSKCTYIGHPPAADKMATEVAKEEVRCVGALARRVGGWVGG